MILIDLFQFLLQKPSDSQLLHRTFFSSTHLSTRCAAADSTCPRPPRPHPPAYCPFHPAHPTHNRPALACTPPLTRVASPSLRTLERSQVRGHTNTRLSPPPPTCTSLHFPASPLSPLSPLFPLSPLPCSHPLLLPASVYLPARPHGALTSITFSPPHVLSPLALPSPLLSPAPPSFPATHKHPHYYHAGRRRTGARG